MVSSRSSVGSGTQTGVSARRQHVGDAGEAVGDAQPAVQRHEQLGHLMHAEHGQPVRRRIIKADSALQIADFVCKRAAARHDHDRARCAARSIASTLSSRPVSARLPPTLTTSGKRAWRAASTTAKLTGGGHAWQGG